MSELLSAADFIAELKRLTASNGRQLHVGDRTLGSSSTIFVNFINLPAGVGVAGGGAEAENNRMSFSVEGFAKNDLSAPAPLGKVKVESRVSAILPRSKRLRAKTGTPGQICKYLADFINQTAKEVEPRFTHTKMASVVADRFIAEQEG